MAAGAVVVAAAVFSCKFLTPLDEHEYAGGSGTVIVTLVDGPCGPLDATCPRNAASAVEIGSYAGSCPATDASAGDREGVDKLLAASPDVRELVPPDMGSIPPLPEPAAGPRAYYVLFRDAQCGVVGWGCTDIAYTNQTQVAVAVRPAPSPALGACYGVSCACEGVTDASIDRPVVGVSDGQARDAACSMALVAAGSLPQAMQSGDVLAGPGVVSTNDGFVVAFRDQWEGEAGSESALRTALVRIDGTLQSGSGAQLKYYDETCTGPIADDGVGIAFDVTRAAGLMAVSVPACAKNGAGATFISFSSDATLLQDSIFNSVGAGGDLTLARAHALAPSYADGNFELAYVSQSAAFSAIVASASLARATAQRANGAATFAAVASTQSLRVSILGTLLDGGSGVDVSAGAPGTPSKPVTRLPDVLSASLDVSSDGALIAGAGSAALFWQAIDGAGRVLGAGSSSGPSGSFASVDVAATGDTTAKYVIAGGATGDVAILLVDGMAGTVTQLPGLSQEPVLHDLLGSFSGTHLAVAAGHNAVAVVWLTDHVLQPGDPTGGWALFACR
jgi:hypothetical protein